MEKGSKRAAHIATANENVHNHKLSERKSNENDCIIVAEWAAIEHTTVLGAQTLFYTLRLRRHRWSIDLLYRVAESGQSKRTIQHTVAWRAARKSTREREMATTKSMNRNGNLNKSMDTICTVRRRVSERTYGETTNLFTFTKQQRKFIDTKKRNKNVHTREAVRHWGQRFNDFSGSSPSFHLQPANFNCEKYPFGLRNKVISAGPITTKMKKEKNESMEFI